MKSLECWGFHLFSNVSSVGLFMTRPIHCDPNSIRTRSNIGNTLSSVVYCFSLMPTVYHTRLFHTLLQLGQVACTFGSMPKNSSMART